MKNRTFLFLVSLAVIVTTAIGGLYEAGVLFLTISPDARINGMGGAGVTSTTGHCAYYNPGNLGLTAFERSFAYTKSHSDWLIQLADDLEYDINSFTLGANIRMLGLDYPFNASFGMQYYRLFFDEGTNDWYDEAGNIIGEFRSEEWANNFAFGIGFDYFLQLGIGYTMKGITSDLVKDNPDPAYKPAKAFAFDYGITAQLPIIRTLKTAVLDREVLSEHLDAEITLAYGASRLNNGSDEIYYVNPENGDPLPKTGRDGFSIKGETFYNNLELVSGIYAREFFLDLVEGDRPSKPAKILSGYEISILDIYQYRSGRIYKFDYYQTEDYSVAVSYDTRGYSIKPSGALRFLCREFCNEENMPAYLRFVVENLDMSYSHSEYTDTKYESTPEDAVADEPGPLEDIEFDEYYLGFRTDFSIFFNND